MKRSYWWPALSALSLAVSASVAHADERESLEAMRQTTMALIDALVDKGVLTREAADAMVKQAQQKAVQVVASQQAAPAAEGATGMAAKPETTASGKPVQRVPYVSDALKAQIRNEVKEEVVAQARAERWGVPNAVPSWVDRIKIDGDFRFRVQTDRPSKSNTEAGAYFDTAYFTYPGVIRAADFADVDDAGNSAVSTTSGRTRERIRLRLGLAAKVTDEVGVGLRLSTGDTKDRVSTNQTLGQNFNKYNFVVDRAFMRVDPTEWLSVQAGRIPNPWFSTEMVWNENLNFEGVAATARYDRLDGDRRLSPFATVGFFPLRESSAPKQNGRWLYGAQVGAAWAPSSRTKLKFGLALYSYNNIEGRLDDHYTGASGSAVPNANYGQYEYPEGLRQKGNTLVDTSAEDLANQGLFWGLAYKFRPLTLTAAAELSHFSPYTLLLSAEYVKNTAFDLGDFQRRYQLEENPGGKDHGVQLKAAFGAASVQDAGQWQASITYRYLGSDAVLDAFADSDLGLGGTNVQGYILGFNYGLYRNTSLNVRYLSSRNIDSTIGGPAFPDAKYKVNSLQVDFNVRF